MHFVLTQHLINETYVDHEKTKIIVRFTFTLCQCIILKIEDI